MSMQAGNPKKPKPPTCHKCGTNVATAPRTIIDGLWTCARCTYEHDYPDREVVPVPRRRVSALIQEETLFPLPPKKPDYA